MGFFHPCRIRAIRVGYRGCFPQLRGGACFGRIFLKGGGGPGDFRRGGGAAQRVPGAKAGSGEFSGCGAAAGSPAGTPWGQWRFCGIFGVWLNGGFVAPSGSPAEKWECGVICFTRAGGRGHRWGGWRPVGVARARIYERACGCVRARAWRVTRSRLPLGDGRKWDNIPLSRLY